MKLTIKLDEINYGDAAVRAIPLLRHSAGNIDGSVGRMAVAITNLPENLIRDIFDAIHAYEKNEILASFAVEYKDRILNTLNDFSRHYKLGLQLNDFTVDQNLTIAAEVYEIDYISILDRFLPEIRSKLLSMGRLVVMFRPMIQNASAAQIVGLLDRFVGDNKEVFLASLVNQNQKKLISAIEDAADKQNIRLKISAIVLEA